MSQMMDDVDATSRESSPEPAPREPTTATTPDIESSGTESKGSTSRSTEPAAQESTTATTPDIESSGAESKGATSRSTAPDLDTQKQNAKQQTAANLDGRDAEDLNAKVTDTENGEVIEVTDPTSNQLDDDLGGTETDFRRDTATRSFGENLSESGGELGRDAADALENQFGDDQSGVVPALGETVGSIPGEAVLTGTDVSQAGQQVIRESAGEGDGTPLETGQNILANAGESVIDGVDQSFNVQPENAADPDTGPAFSVREPAEEQVAASATIGAVGLAAGGLGSSALGSGARAAGSAGRRAITDFGPDGSRIDVIPGTGRADPRSDGTGSISDGGQITGRKTTEREATIERGDEVETDTDVDQFVGGPDESRSQLQQEGIVRAIEQDAEAGRLTDDSRSADRSSTQSDPRAEAERRTPPASEFESEQARQREVDRIEERLRPETITQEDVQSAGATDATQSDATGMSGQGSQTGVTSQRPTGGGEGLSMSGSAFGGSAGTIGSSDSAGTGESFSLSGSSFGGGSAGTIGASESTARSTEVTSFTPVTITDQTSEQAVSETSGIEDEVFDQTVETSVSETSATDVSSATDNNILTEADTGSSTQSGQTRERTQQRGRQRGDARQRGGQRQRQARQNQRQLFRNPDQPVRTRDSDQSRRRTPERPELPPLPEDDDEEGRVLGPQLGEDVTTVMEIDEDPLDGFLSGDDR
jgi:hypothetical protein